MVIRMSGGRVAMARRSDAAVSPDRTATVTLGGGCPLLSATWVMPVSGARRLRSTSTASALSGETYNTRQRCLAGGMASRVSLSKAQRKAASVLPDPVGAMTNALSPAEIACQAPCCACVGAAKTSSNHVRVACAKLSSGSSGTELSCLAAPTVNGGGVTHQSSVMIAALGPKSTPGIRMSPGTVSPVTATPTAPTGASPTSQSRPTH